MSKKMEERPGAVRSEFLFCYDARMCNPNGDPDENHPRIDTVTDKNLVTEFRLKRTIRDYLAKEKPIFLREEIKNEQGDRKTIDELAEPEIEEYKKNNKFSIKNALLKKYIDLRLFGLLFAAKGIEVKGKKTKQSINFKQTGPVQFAIGQSLNRVEKIPIRMTRVAPTKEEARGGAFGEKWILRYSFITFHGFLNDFVAKEAHLSEEDVLDMMRAMWFGTTGLSTTSKYGQQSRLLVRVKYKNSYAYIGDLDQMITLDPDEKKLEDISQVVLNVSDLLKALSDTKDDLDEIEWICDNELRCKRDETIGPFGSLIKEWSEETRVNVVNLLEQWHTKEVN